MRGVMVPVQSQIRCSGCRRRLADFVNELASGQVILELKCPRCGHPHLEIIRPAVHGAAENRLQTRSNAVGDIQ